MYAIRNYKYQHKDCKHFGWLTLLSMCISCVCVCVCSCVSMCAPWGLSCSGCILTFDLC